MNNGGGDRSANAGMSSVNADEKSAHRKSKVSYGRLLRVGLVGPKPRPKGVGDGQQVSIPAPLTDRFKTKRGPGKVGRAGDWLSPFPNVGVSWEANPLAR